MPVGNAVKIIIGIGQKPVDATIEAGMTVRQVMEKQGLKIPDAKDIRVNGNPATLDHELMPGDSVTFLPKIEGGA